MNRFTDLAGFDPAPTKVAWPSTLGVRLADAAQCATVTAEAAGTLFTDATQLTYFTEDGVIYEAFDPERDDRVVVKQLDLHIEDPATPALMAVAQKLCEFSHPNVLQMLSVGVHAGFVYIVYDFVKGTVLSSTGFPCASR